jgi:hypothetical protein
VGAFVAFPIFSIKTRIQVDPDKYQTLMQSLFLVVGEEGIAALWSGFLVAAIG